MEFEDSVDKADVPDGPKRHVTRKGVWVDLTERAIADHAQDKVTVVVFKNEQEYQRFRNGIQIPMRNAGWRYAPEVFDLPDGRIRVYIRVERLSQSNGRPRQPARSGIRPVHG